MFQFDRYTACVATEQRFSSGGPGSLMSSSLARMPLANKERLSSFALVCLRETTVGEELVLVLLMLVKQQFLVLDARSSFCEVLGKLDLHTCTSGRCQQNDSTMQRWPTKAY